MRQWVSLDRTGTLTRQQILDANDLLDAMDEAAAPPPKAP